MRRRYKIMDKKKLTAIGKSAYGNCLRIKILAVKLREIGQCTIKSMFFKNGHFGLGHGGTFGPMDSLGRRCYGVRMSGQDVERGTFLIVMRYESEES